MAALVDFLLELNTGNLDFKIIENSEVIKLYFSDSHAIQNNNYEESKY